MYCSPEFHDTTSKHPDLEKLKTVWQNIYAKTRHQALPYKLSFTGGEVTANKSFLPLIEYLKTGNFGVEQIFITTNGSASINYYTKLAKLVNGISFSTHSEFIDEQEFFNKARALNKLMVRPVRSFHVNIMNEFWNQDRIELYKQWLDHYGISHSINQIDYSKQTRNFQTLKGVYNLEQV
jgi:organic radical activating enzyme